MATLFNNNKNTEDILTRTLLKESLGFEGFYWYPLDASPKPLIAEYFDEDVFIEKFGINKLVELIGQLGYLKLNLIVETKEDEKIDVADLEEYCGVEKIYCDEKVEWGIYFSHENTVTFVGATIVTALKENRRGWKVFSDSWESS